MGRLALTWRLGNRRIPDIKCRFLERVENLGDIAMSTEQHDDAISRYSVALSLNLAAPRLFIKRSKACVASGLWEAALNDANKVCSLSYAVWFMSTDCRQSIKLDPMSPLGYESMHAALHKAGDYENAINAFEMMLSKMSQSSGLEIHGEDLDVMLNFIY